MKSWNINAPDLERWTPYEFLKALEIELTPPERQTPRRESKGRVGPKDIPEVNWGNLIKKTGKAMKRSLHVIDGKEVGGDQEKKDAILDSLEGHIRERRRILAAELLTKRESIVQEWKKKLEAP